MLLKHLAGKRFATDADVRKTITSCLQTLDTGFFNSGIQNLVPRRGKCLNFIGDCVQVVFTICHPGTFCESQFDKNLSISVCYYTFEIPLYILCAINGVLLPYMNPAIFTGGEVL